MYGSTCFFILHHARHALSTLPMKRPVLRLKNCANDSCSQLPTRRSESLSCSAEWISGGFLGHPPAADVHIYTIWHVLENSNLRGSWKTHKYLRTNGATQTTQTTYPCNPAQDAARGFGTLLLAFFQAGCDCHGARHIDGCKAHLVSALLWRCMTQAPRIALGSIWLLLDHQVMQLGINLLPSGTSGCTGQRSWKFAWPTDHHCCCCCGGCSLGPWSKQSTQNRSKCMASIAGVGEDKKESTVIFMFSEFHHAGTYGIRQSSLGALAVYKLTT